MPDRSLYDETEEKIVAVEKGISLLKSELRRLHLVQRCQHAKLVDLYVDMTYGWSFRFCLDCGVHEGFNPGFKHSVLPAKPGQDVPHFDIDITDRDMLRQAKGRDLFTLLKHFADK